MNKSFFLKADDQPYLLLNLIFSLIIASVIIYSAIIPPESTRYPIFSNYTSITGAESISTGLSRSFSYLVRLEVTKAREMNPYGIRVFGFFLAQGFMRIFFSILSIRLRNYSNYLIITDICISVLLFTWVFRPFFYALISLFSAAFR